MNLQRLIKVKSAFDPRSVPNLAAWFDAQATSQLTFNSATISAFSGIDVNNNNFVSGVAVNQPTFVTNSINGRPAVRAVDSTDLIGVVDNASLDYTSASVFVVCKRHTNTGNSQVVANKYLGTPNNEWQIQVNASSTYEAQISTDGTTAATVSNSAINVVGLPVIIDLQMAASGHSLSVNNNTPGTASGFAPFNSTHNIVLLKQATGTSTWAGDIGEFLFYTNMVNNDQRLAILSYLSHKWGIGLSGGAS